MLRIKDTCEYDKAQDLINDENSPFWLSSDYDGLDLMNFETREHFYNKNEIIEVLKAHNMTEEAEQVAQIKLVPYAQKGTFERLAKEALELYTTAEDITLEPDDTIYVWHWWNEEQGKECVEVSTRNHQPEGVAVMVSDLKNISEWWQIEWDNAY